MQNSSDVRLPTPCTIPDAAAATTSYNNACTQVFAPAALAANLREHPEHRQGTPSLRMPELRVEGTFDPHSPYPIEQRVVFARWIIGNVRLGRDSSHLPRTSETWGLRGNTSASRSNTRPHGGSQNCEFLPDAIVAVDHQPAPSDLATCTGTPTRSTSAKWRANLRCEGADAACDAEYLQRGYLPITAGHEALHDFRWRFHIAILESAVHHYHGGNLRRRAACVGK